MSARLFTVLFLCTGNSARSIMAEAVLKKLAPEKFSAYSAGSHPKGTVHPYALEALERFQYPTGGLRSKSWEEFTGPNAPPLDFIFTLCDGAAHEACPLWPGQPVTAHWGLPDPAAAEGTEETKRMAFVEILRMLRRRLDPFIQLPVPVLERLIHKHAREGVDTPTAPTP